MNSSSSQRTYIKMQNKILEDSKNLCLLVEAISTKSQNVPWTIRIDGKQIQNERIRRVSIDRFYEIVTGEKEAFKKLVQVLPKIIDEVVKNIQRTGIENSVLDEWKKLSSNEDILKTLYLLAFKTYNGFDNFEFFK